MNRRNFLRCAPFVPAVAMIPTVASNKDEDSKPPMALLIDPYMVNMKDLEDLKVPTGTKLVRLRRPAWGSGEPIRRIY